MGLTQKLDRLMQFAFFLATEAKCFSDYSLLSCVSPNSIGLTQQQKKYLFVEYRLLGKLANNTL